MPEGESERQYIGGAEIQLKPHQLPATGFPHSNLFLSIRKLARSATKASPTLNRIK
jgi:hypothetical protein